MHPTYPTNCAYVVSKVDEYRPLVNGNAHEFYHSVYHKSYHSSCTACFVAAGRCRLCLSN